MMVGVAGIHRLLSIAKTGAGARNYLCRWNGRRIASVVGGLVAVPVIASPTSVATGVSFGGVAALLGCSTVAPQRHVVNIDNGSRACVASCIKPALIRKRVSSWFQQYFHHTTFCAERDGLCASQTRCARVSDVGQHSARSKQSLWQTARSATQPR